MKKRKFIGYDIFKLVVAILLALLLLFVFRQCAIVTPTFDAVGSDLVEGPNDFSGAGSKNASMGLLVNDEEASTFSSDADGLWATEAELAAGENTVQAVQYNRKGDVIAESDVLMLDADYATVTPSFELPEGDLVEGSHELSGVGTPMAAMGLMVDGELVSEFTADADGNWSTSYDLSAGDHTIQVVELDENGEVVVASDEASVTVDYAPMAPSIDLPEGGFVEGSNTLSGMGTPMAAMGLMVNGELVSEFTADENGNWSTDVDLPAGDVDVQVVELDADGNVIAESDVSTTPVDYEIVTPSLTLGEDGLVEGMNTLSGVATPMAAMGLMVNGELVSEFTADADGNWSTDVELPAGTADVQVVQFDADGNVIAESTISSVNADYETVVPTINLPTGDIVEGVSTLSGTATPNAALGLMVNGELVSEFTADADGNWSKDVNLPAGDLDIQVVELDENGDVVVESTAMPMNVSIYNPEETVIDEAPDTSNCGVGKINNGLYVVNYCQNLTRIAQALEVDLDALIEANPDIEDPNLIFPGQRLVIPEAE